MIPSSVPKKHTTPPSIATAWLLLSHAGWIALAIACEAIATSLLVYLTTLDGRNATVQALTITWAALGVAFLLWTAYAVGTTWRSNSAFKRPVFGPLAFSLVYVLLALTLAMAVWMIVTVAQQ